MTDLVIDAALPGMALLHELPRLLEVLSRLLASWLGPAARLRASRVAVRQFLPGKRCSAELELLVGAERRRILAKLYCDDQGGRVYETLRELRDHGFDAGPFTVPRPLAYDSAHQLLLLEWAEGESLQSRLLASSDAREGVEAAARWLLTLHGSGLTSGRRYTFSRHVETLAGWMQQLAEVFPEGERLLADLLTGIRERGGALSEWIPGPIHRDFSPEHVVMTDAGVVVLDLDEFCQYDPLFDVAHFAAQLRFLGLTQFGALHRFDELVDRFVACYEAGGARVYGDRRRLYEAMAYVKLGRLVTLVRRARDWRQILPPLLGEARRLVEGYDT
jgi:hypothetical protein